MPKALVLTLGDQEVFCYLWMLRVLSIEQIRRLRYFRHDSGQLSNLNNVRMRLKRLEDAGFLRSDFVRQEASERRMKVYFLGMEALPVLAKWGIEQRQLYAFRSLNSYQQIYHALLVSQCAVSVVESIRFSDVDLVSLAPFGLQFYHTHAIGNPQKIKHTERFITQCDVSELGSREVCRIRPDLVFGLKKQKYARLYFVEADRGFEGHTEIAAKQQGYEIFFRSEHPLHSSLKWWQEYGEVRDFRVLFVTTTDRRIELLRESLKKVPGFELLAFCTQESLKVSNMVFDRIWHIADGSKRELIRR